VYENLSQIGGRFHPGEFFQGQRSYDLMPLFEPVNIEDGAMMQRDALKFSGRA